MRGSFKILWKYLKQPQRYSQGLGWNWLMEKTWSRKSHDTVPLSQKFVRRYLYPCLLYSQTRHIYICSTFCASPTFWPTCHMLWRRSYFCLLQLFFVVDNQGRLFAMLLYLADTPIFRENKSGVEDRSSTGSTYRKNWSLIWNVSCKRDEALIARDLNSRPMRNKIIINFF